MKTITITEAKRGLGKYLKQAAAGEDIGIVSGADIISLRKVEVISADRFETPGASIESSNAAWPLPPAFDGGRVDGALHHDKYLYDKPRGSKSPKSRK